MLVSKNNILDLDTRQRIYDYIEKNPGMHSRELSRNMNIPLTTLRYHLNVLKKKELIEAKHIGSYKKFFVSGKVCNLDKELLTLFRKKIPCRMFLFLSYSSACNQKDLSEELEVDPALISYHLKKMLKLGIIEKAPVENGLLFPFNNKISQVYWEKQTVGREIYYRVKDNNQITLRICRLLVKNKDSIEDKVLIEAFLDFYKYCMKYGITDKQLIKNYKKKIIERNGEKKIYAKKPENDLGIKLILEFLKPPFCA